MGRHHSTSGLAPDEISFDVIDEVTGKAADLEKIAAESWASGLGYVTGWAISDEGELILRDDEGRFEMAPEERFVIRLVTS